MSDEEPVTLEVDDGYVGVASILPGEPETVTLDIHDAITTSSSPQPGEEEDPPDGGDR